MNRWSARYGFEKTGKEILDKAKCSSNGRYVAVNLNNYHTIEFRLFRGTLKYNTFIATLQLVDEICNVALFMSEEEIAEQSWTNFVRNIHHAELIQYLKERRLYVNDEVCKSLGNLTEAIEKGVITESIVNRAEALEKQKTDIQIKLNICISSDL